MKVTMRIKFKEKDTNYDKYIGTCRITEIFDDIAEELLIRSEGHRGVLKEYEELEFIKPLVCGDHVDIVGEIIAFDDKILKIKFEVFKVLDAEEEEYLLIPELTNKAVGVFEIFKN